MKDTGAFWIVLFDSTSEVLLAEKLLKKTGIPHKVIPVPRHLSSNCGVCIRFSSPDTERVRSVLAGRVTARDSVPLAWPLFDNGGTVLIILSYIDDKRYL